MQVGWVSKLDHRTKCDQVPRPPVELEHLALNEKEENEVFLHKDILLLIAILVRNPQVSPIVHLQHEVFHNHESIDEPPTLRAHRLRGFIKSPRV